MEKITTGRIINFFVWIDKENGEARGCAEYATANKSEKVYFKESEILELLKINLENLDTKKINERIKQKLDENIYRMRILEKIIIDGLFEKTGD